MHMAQWDHGLGTRIDEFAHWNYSLGTRIKFAWFRLKYNLNRTQLHTPNSTWPVFKPMTFIWRTVHFMSMRCLSTTEPSGTSKRIQTRLKGRLCNTLEIWKFWSVFFYFLFLFIFCGEGWGGGGGDRDKADNIISLSAHFLFHLFI